MQDALWSVYTPGQENTFDILPEYFEVTKAIRTYVRNLETPTDTPHGLDND